MAAKIVDGRRRVRDPFKSGGVPRILAGDRAVLEAPEKIENENKLRGSGDEGGIGHKHMRGLQSSAVRGAGSIRVAAYAACQADEMHGHEDAVGAHKSEPEVKLAQRFAHHAAEHLRKPEICGGENPEDGSHAHHQMEVRDYVIGSVEHIVHSRLSKE